MSLIRRRSNMLRGRALTYRRAGMLSVPQIMFFHLLSVFIRRNECIKLQNIAQMRQKMQAACHLLRIIPQRRNGRKKRRIGMRDEPCP